MSKIVIAPLKATTWTFTVEAIKFGNEAQDWP